MLQKIQSSSTHLDCFNFLSFPWLVPTVRFLFRMISYKQRFSLCSLTLYYCICNKRCIKMQSLGDQSGSLLDSAGNIRLRNVAAAAAKSLQSCPTLCDPIDGLLPGSSVPGILQARTLEWVAIERCWLQFLSQQKHVLFCAVDYVEVLKGNSHYTSKKGFNFAH